MIGDKWMFEDLFMWLNLGLTFYVLAIDSSR